MSDRFLSWYQVSQLLPPDSTIEGIMAQTLGGIDTGATFSMAANVPDAIDLVERNDSVMLRHGLVVFPQIQILQYYVDFLVVVGVPGIVYGLRDTSLHAFLVECDGMEFHGLKSGRTASDMDREQAITRTTGLSMLRFSGPEILFHTNLVAEVLSARVEASRAVQECGAAVLETGLFANVLRSVRHLSYHPTLRTEYWQRNYPEEDGRQFDELRCAVHELRKEVAISRKTGNSPSVNDPDHGDLVHVSSIIARLLKRVADGLVQ